MLYLFEGFELDEENFSLRRNGQRLSIEPRALGVLIVLVRNQGRLLEKRELIDTVWKGTFVEESTLTRAIAILRKLLEDDPRSPRFIETVPTRGYRFIAPVESVERTPELPAEVPPAEPQPPPPSATLIPPPASHRITVYLASAAVLLAAIGWITVRNLRSHRPAPNPKDVTLVLANFTNTTGDPVFDETLRQGMMVQLEQSPILRFASEGQIQKTLRLMTKTSQTPVTSDLSRELCQRVNAGIVLDGTISRLGTAYVLGLRARNCSTGEELDAEQVQIARKEDALEALSKIATTFRERVGESIPSIKNHDTPLAEATTPSLEALRAFSQALKVFNTSGSGGAIPLFQQAIESDPQFAMAHVWLGRMYADFGEDARSEESTRKAFELRTRASDRERFSIDVSYDLIVTGNLIKARESCEAWKQMYPRDTYPRAFLSGIVDPAFGQYEAALDEGKKMIEIDPDFVLGYRNVVLNSVALNRLSEAEAVLQTAAKRKLFLPSFITDSYRIAFLKGDAAGMKHAAIEAPTNPWIMNYEANTLARDGHLAPAREMSARAIGRARQTSRLDTEAQLQIASAFRETFYGDPHLAAQQARDARKLSTGKATEYGAAYVLASTGNSSEAAKITAALASRFPEDTIVQYAFVPTLQALLALNQHQPQKAIEILRVTQPYEFNPPLHPIFLRGQALLAMGRAAEAATEFERVLKYPGLILNDPLSVMTRLQLGRAYALAGDKTRARAQYAAILGPWRTADASFAARQQAIKEYTKL